MISPAISPDAVNARTVDMSPRAVFHEWELIGTFNTIESARPVLDCLRASGREAYMTLIGGLSVVARRTNGEWPVAASRRSEPIVQRASVSESALVSS